MLKIGKSAIRTENFVLLRGLKQILYVVHLRPEDAKIVFICSPFSVSLSLLVHAAVAVRYRGEWWVVQVFHM